MTQEEFDKIIGREKSFANMDFRGVEFPLDCRQKRFVNCKISSISDVDFTGSEFYNTEFICTIPNCIFDNAIFHRCDFSAMVISKCSFTEADIMYSNFCSTEILECKFNKTELHECNFNRAFIKNSNIYDAIMYGADFVSVVTEGFKVYQVGPIGYHRSILYFPDQDRVICTGIYFESYTLKEFEKTVRENNECIAAIKFFKSIKNKKKQHLKHSFVIPSNKNLRDRIIQIGPTKDGNIITYFTEFDRVQVGDKFYSFEEYKAVYRFKGFIYRIAGNCFEEAKNRKPAILD